MLHTFKCGGHRFAYDSASGTLISPDELAFKMLDYIELPMPKDCPSALRYDLAKYDSAAISDTYESLCKLNSEGKLFAPEKDFTPTEPAEKPGNTVLKTAGGKICSDSNPHINGETGLEIAESDGETLSEEKLPEVIKEIDRLSRDIARRGETERIFAPAVTFEHTFAECRDCFARRNCAAGCPSTVRCALERKRFECELAYNFSKQK